MLLLEADAAAPKYSERQLREMKAYDAFLYAQKTTTSEKDKNMVYNILSSEYLSHKNGFILKLRELVDFRIDKSTDFFWFVLFIVSTSRSYSNSNAFILFPLNDIFVRTHHAKNFNAFELSARGAMGRRSPKLNHIYKRACIIN